MLWRKHDDTLRPSVTDYFVGKGCHIASRSLADEENPRNDRKGG